MICIISPAKSLDADFNAKPLLPSSSPHFINFSDALAKSLKEGCSAADYKRTMKISAEIAARTHEQYQSYIFNSNSSKSTPCTATSTHKQAGLLFDGPAYRGLDCKSLTEKEMINCNQHVRFLSGLYGLLKPSDSIQQHRLEMSSKGLPFPNNTPTLYEYWRDNITEHINNDLLPSGKKSKCILLDCASKEYSGAIDVKNIRKKDISIIRCEFTDKGKIVSVYAKRARGLMCRYVAKNSDRIDATSASAFDNWIDILKKFNYEGYQFVSSQSSADYFVFNRTSVPPASDKLNVATNTCSQGGANVGGGDEDEESNRQVGRKKKR